MGDINFLMRMARLQSNDPTSSDVWDYYNNRDPLMQDMSGMTPLSDRPGMDLAVNGSKAAMNAWIARMLLDAPGPAKALAAVPGLMAAQNTGEAYRNYQQLQGTHPMQQRESAWRTLMEAAQRPTSQTPFNRGGGAY